MNANPSDKLSDLVLALQERLQFFWNFYFGTCLALLAFVASVTDKTPNVSGNFAVKGAVTTLFALFVIGNVEGLVKFARRLTEASAELRRHVKENKCEPAAVIISNLDFRFTVPAAIIGHIIGDIIVIASIWLYLNPK
jgi:hypothetical protein